MIFTLISNSFNNIYMSHGTLFSHISMHIQHLQDSNGRCRRDASYLWSMHAQHFPAWLKQQASSIRIYKFLFFVSY